VSVLVLILIRFAAFADAIQAVRFMEFSDIGGCHRHDAANARCAGIESHQHAIAGSHVGHLDGFAFFRSLSPGAIFWAMVSGVSLATTGPPWSGRISTSALCGRKPVTVPTNDLGCGPCAAKQATVHRTIKICFISPL
jgi:hypothetical protein